MSDVATVALIGGAVVLVWMLAGWLAGGCYPMTKSVEQRVREIVAEALGVELSGVSLETTPGASGDAVTRVCDEFVVDPDSYGIEDAVTVGDLVRCVEAAMVEEARGPVEAERVREG